VSVFAVSAQSAKNPKMIKFASNALKFAATAFVLASVFSLLGCSSDSGASGPTAAGGSSAGGASAHAGSSGAPAGGSASLAGTGGGGNGGGGSSGNASGGSANGGAGNGGRTGATAGSANGGAAGGGGGGANGGSSNGGSAGTAGAASGNSALDKDCTSACAAQTKLDCSNGSDCQSLCLAPGNTSDTQVKCQSEYDAMLHCDAPLAASKWMCSQDAEPVPVAGQCTSAVCAYACCVGALVADQDLWSRCMPTCAQ
jgi:hypothetical protein